jgi:hypothetical protein
VRPGSGTGTPLLICCGMGISYEVFDLMVDALDPGIAIVRVDVPDVGGSPVRVWPYGFPELARLLAVLLDELGYQAGRRPGLLLGVVRWPSSSPFSTAAGAAGWC